MATTGTTLTVPVQGVSVDAGKALGKLKDQKTRECVEWLLREGKLKDGVVKSKDAEEAAKRVPFTVEELCDALVPIAAMVVHAPVSNFAVGAVALACNGDIVIGANIEILGMPLAVTGHAEQAALSRALAVGGAPPKLIALDITPCGHCRQLLREAYEASGKKFTIRLRGKNTDFEAMLPDAFGPTDLHIDPRSMGQTTKRILLETKEPLAVAAAKVAASAYSPYGNCYAGLAVQTADGHIVAGAYQENAAYNPSISPAEAVLAELGGRGLSFASVTHAVLVEGFPEHSLQDPLVSHKDITAMLLRGINPAVAYTYFRVKAADL